MTALALAMSACGKSNDNKAATTTTNGKAPTTVKVQAGVNDPKDRNIAVLAFLPASVTIKAGSSVEWKVPGPEPHTITFLPTGQTPPPPSDPANAALRAKSTTGAYDGSQTFSSELIPQGPNAATYSVSFPKEGSFTYQCLIHPGMTGTVKVVADDASAEQQSAINKRAITEEQQWLAEGRAAKKKLTETPLQKTANADGSTTWTIEMGVDTQHTSVLAFQPANADIKAGDKVTFINNSAAPHTASFKGSGTLPQNPESTEAQTPSPGPSPQTLTATGTFNSGLLPPNVPPGSGPPAAARSFTFNVPTAGEYSYICIFHSPSGMGGTIKAS
ncbi:MAG TPA: plastocyanin/azurin family copper-binding protein [Acidimicrobiales bacterium]|nr:plastocyanin/azurin family copper-binding protein [Acidimicrobiales bacterium]